MKQLRKPTTKVVSIMLSVLMLTGLFNIVPFSVGAADGTQTLTVDLFEPSLTNDYYENIALETKIGGSTVEGASHSVQPGDQISVTARLKSNDYRFHVTGMTMTYTRDGEEKNVDAELEILDAYRNVRVDISGGTVNATGGTNAAGLGAGYHSYSDVVISGGTVKAVGGNNSAGIGGGSSTVTLTYTDELSITSDSYVGTVTLEKPFTDGTIVFEAGDVSDNSALNNKTLTPSAGIGVSLAGHSISLDGDIGVSFYMELSESVIAHQNTAYMHFTIPVKNGTTEQNMLVKDASKKEVNGKTYYVFKCGVAAKEMASQIKAQMFDNDLAGTEYTYSVKEYAAYLLEHAGEREDFAAAAPLVKAMLNYGAYAQIYFDKNTDTLANSVLSEADKELGDVNITAPDKEFNLPESVSFEGATLSLKSETTLSLYFKSSTTLTFSVNGKKVETAEDDGCQIARIRGIAAKELQNGFKLNVSAGEKNGSVTYSPMNYCYSALNGGTDNENLINTVKALCLYSQAANAFFLD